MGCELPTVIYDNPLDTSTLETPSLIFFPNQADVGVGNTVTFQVMVVKANDLGGAQIEIEYNTTRLLLNTVTIGDYLKDDTDPLFIYDNDSDNGLVSIYTSYLGSDSTESNVAGNIAYLVFTAITPGESILSFTNTCELADPDDNILQIMSYGEGVVNAQ